MLRRFWGLHIAAQILAVLSALAGTTAAVLIVGTAAPAPQATKPLGPESLSCERGYSRVEKVSIDGDARHFAAYLDARCDAGACESQRPASIETVLCHAETAWLGEGRARSMELALGNDGKTRYLVRGSDGAWAVVDPVRGDSFGGAGQPRGCAKK